MSQRHPDDGAARKSLPRWQSRAAGLVATVVQLSVLSCLLLFTVTDLHGDLADDDYNAPVVVISEVFNALGLPVEANMVIALVLAVLGAALRRRKRAALWALLLFQAVSFTTSTSVILLLTLAPDAADVQADVVAEILSYTWWNPLLTLAVGAFLLTLLPAFPARLAIGAWRRALGMLGSGMVVVVFLGWGLTQLYPASAFEPTDRLLWVLYQVTGELPPAQPIGVVDGPGSLSVTLSVLSALVLAYALAVFFRAVRSQRLMSPAEELRLRELLAEYGERDSLGYFATRRDKSVLFAPGGQAAVTYRVLGGTSLASGDPIGDPQYWPQAVQVWLAEARLYGWVPGVLGASEEGAHAYAAAGLKVLEIGDEAILEVRDFSLTGRHRRAVRQAVSRVVRAGYTSRIRRHSEIPPHEMGELVDLAQLWRGEGSERGFSMALGRLDDPSDGRCVVVEAFDAKGELRGLLSFVPWGRTGLSLDLMRRDRNAENGLNEFLVSELAEASGRLGVQRISLNFAMFRAVFEEGSQLGAGPVLRLWRRVLSLFSRVFQLESLYRANAKYGPRWEPRFLCYGGSRKLPRVGIVAGVAEGFLPATRNLRRNSARDLRTGAVAAEFVRQVEAIDERARTVRAPAARLPDQVRVRRRKLDKLREVGIDPYPVNFDRQRQLGEVVAEHDGLAPDTHTGEHVHVAGRVVAKRELGGLCFAVLRDLTGELQVMLAVDVLGKAGLDDWKLAVDIGDLVGVRGQVVTSRGGELSVLATSWEMTAKCLHPLPDRRKGLADPEAKVRQRYLDLAVNPDSAAMLRLRSTVVRSVREFLHERQYLEVETPMLQAVHGGANARPFVTHINAYDMRMYLRIAPELYLKRLCVAGVDRVFELNRNFRNEGADASHNPEFTMLEAYQAYADYDTMLRLTRELIQHAATQAHGAPVARHRDRDGRLTEHDLSGEWPVIGCYDAVSAALGEQVTPDTGTERLRRHVEAAGLTSAEDAGHAQLVQHLYDHLVEARTTTPVFYRDFPAEGSPLTRRHRTDPRLAERWDLVAFGAEIGTAYSELTDPVEQRDRLEAQSLRAASGDVEAMELDEDFLRALEYGMPPTGGLGIGVDRLLMMLSGASIRQTVLFPFARPLGGRGRHADW
ncbi:lysyl-tRNA synthetase class 2 [Crossiella equi]|uniref:Lysine--tRNA ligase n=1 Tax=Crossiella equi TaxID=130796 RepID=A0ABS5ABA9_9PSEU|nr:bifunctional lysylphosphatidylglycerol synthetase/lysine--tRNA ligase LysX [Crossiella equi]MBP2473872.1 lysyl-tRNA synthetase class 2 [Crossiella equi]